MSTPQTSPRYLDKVELGLQLNVLNDMESIEALEVAKEEAYLAYAEAARAIHEAYWNRLQEQLPEIIKLIGECYPAAVVETERTEWTNSDEFAFDHWVYIRFPGGVSSEEESAFYDWLQSAVSLSRERGQTFAVRADLGAVVDCRHGRHVVG